MTDTDLRATEPGAFPIDPAHQRRCEFLSGLRDVVRHLERNVDLLDAYPTLRLLIPVDTADELAVKASMLGGGRTKHATDSFIDVTRDFGGGVEVQVYAPRNEVCEAKVVGQRTVTKPDPEALAAVPTIEVVEDVIEWTCTPVLAQTVTQKRVADFENYATPADLRRDPGNRYDLDFAECHDDPAHDMDEAF